MLTGAEVVGVAQGPEATLKRIAATGADVVVVGLRVAGESGLNLVARCARECPRFAFERLESEIEVRGAIFG